MISKEIFWGDIKIVPRGGIFQKPAWFKCAYVLLLCNFQCYFHVRLLFSLLQDIVEKEFSMIILALLGYGPITSSSLVRDY